MNKNIIVLLGDYNLCCASYAQAKNEKWLTSTYRKRQKKGHFTGSSRINLSRNKTENTRQNGIFFVSAFILTAHKTYMLQRSNKKKSKYFISLFLLLNIPKTVFVAFEDEIENDANQKQAVLHKTQLETANGPNIVTDIFTRFNHLCS